MYFCESVLLKTNLPSLNFHRTVAYKWASYKDSQG